MEPKDKKEGRSFLRRRNRVEKKEKEGIRLRLINVTVIVAACVLAVLLLIASFRTFAGFQEMHEATERYVIAQGDASMIQEASTYLTDRVRTFVATGDRAALDDFFTEVQVTRRRDVAIEDMQEYLAGTNTLRYLDEALRYSNELVQIEYHSIRLAIEAYGDNIDQYPAALQSVTLSEQEYAMDKESQLDLAISMLFDDTYQSYKTRITESVQKAGSVLIEEMSHRLSETEENFGRTLLYETLLIATDILVVLAMVLAVTYMMIRPMEKVVKAITANSDVPVIGAYELRFLSRAYNAVFEQSRRHREQLSYEASHDQMTGLFNRAVFDRTRMTNERRAHAMILVDVDKFKHFNDTYGHSVGDQVLQKVSGALKANFRSEDYVCRIGGDEFAVVMVHANSDMRDIVETKLKQAMTLLRDTSDGLPIVTLSIGVAFGDRKQPTEDIYKDADAALYAVKNRGGDGIAFYGEV